MQAVPAHPAQAQFTALCQAHGSVGTRAGPAHRHHGQRCQARLRKPGAEQSPGCLSIATGRCQPKARKPMSLWGWQPPLSGERPQGLGEVDAWLQVPGVSASVPATSSFTVDSRLRGPRGGGLGWGQQRCWETRQEPLPGAGAGRTQMRGQKRSRSAGREPGRQGDRPDWGVGWPLRPASVS